MRRMTLRLFTAWALLAVLPGASILHSVPAAAQSGEQKSAGSPASAEAKADDYTIGAGDVLSISISDEPDWGGKYRISSSGMIEIAGLSDPIRAEGRTPHELSRDIQKALIDGKQFRNPSVHVFVDEFHGSTVTVLGAVAKPASYPLLKRTTLLEALSMAGGALPDAGGTVTVVRGPASAEATNTKEGSAQIIDMARLARGEDPDGNIVVRSGDVLNVSTAQLVYVVGAVMKPGGFALPDPAQGMSVIRALAMAEGFRPYAGSHRGLILRQSTSDTARREVPVDLQEILAGKSTDVVLAPDDILYVPDSNGKKTLKIMGDVALSLINGIAVYGVGYRVGAL